jgi:hypothetical protein
MICSPPLLHYETNFKYFWLGLKKMVLGCPMDCSHHGLKLSDTANANAGVGRGVGFPQ